jgi:hypothetical protein
MLCIVGGLSMIVSGITSTLEYLPALREGINEVLSYSVIIPFELIMGILTGLTAIGGLGVIIGGMVLTSRHVEGGRILIKISMGMGALSLMMSLVQLVWAGTLAMPLSIQLTQSLGWIGAMLAVVAGTISEQQPIINRA